MEREGAVIHIIHQLSATVCFKKDTWNTLSYYMQWKHLFPWFCLEIMVVVLVTNFLRPKQQPRFRNNTMKKLLRSHYSLITFWSGKLCKSKKKTITCTTCASWDKLYKTWVINASCCTHRQILFFFRSSLFGFQLFASSN